MAVEELVKKTGKKSATTMRVDFRDGSSRVSIDRAFDDLVLMILLALAKERCQNTWRKVVHEIHALSIMKTRLWVLESKRAHVEKIPCDVQFLSKTSYASKVPKLAALRVFYDEVSALGDLVKGYLHTELNHW